MPYVDRDQFGNINAIYARPQREEHEFVSEAAIWIDPQAQKLTLLAIARENRETLISRLTWLGRECDLALAAALEVSIDPENDPAVILQNSNIQAVETAINSLVNAFDDPRVVASVNGAVKQAVQIVYAEIVQAFKLAAPALYARMKKLDTL